MEKYLAETETLYQHINKGDWSLFFLGVVIVIIITLFVAFISKKSTKNSVDSGGSGDDDEL